MRIGGCALPVAVPTAKQPWRACGSVSANIPEGDSGGTGADRGRFLEYALGSARNTLVWYEASWSVLHDDAINSRIDILDQVEHLLITTIPLTRRESIRRQLGPSVSDLVSLLVIRYSCTARPYRPNSASTGVRTSRRAASQPATMPSTSASPMAKATMSGVMSEKRRGVR
jgi:four helix bundle protein